MFSFSIIFDIEMSQMTLEIEIIICGLQRPIDPTAITYQSNEGARASAAMVLTNTSQYIHHHHAWY